jgi:predicted O-linked N-acetylglucosamine transferase (SPINDLY family)
MPRRPAPPPGPQDPERRLRIAFLSPDMRAHAVAWYLDTLFEYLDRSRFHLTAYYTGGAEDDTSRRLASLVDAWHNVTSLSIPALDQRIRADSIDILLELSGHTRNHRLPLMQLRPAPLQITFQGYPNTTGLSAIDYHIVDSYCNPPGTEAFSVEKLLRIDPVWFCYKPAPGPPPVAPLPSLSRAGTERETVFGSFNALMKLNDRTVAMWTRAVRETPGSRLLIKNLQLQQPQARELTRTRFEAAGVPPDRLEVIGHTGGHADHLATYNRVDLCLDSWPYSGMTTSCEALLMGRPVVTLVGETHAARVGLCILANVGLEDLVAKSEDDYVRLVTALARDPARLAALSTSLRERFLTSPVCDGPGHAARFGAALRQVWRDHCAAPADQR